MYRILFDYIVLLHDNIYVWSFLVPQRSMIIQNCINIRRDNFVHRFYIMSTITENYVHVFINIVVWF